MGAGNLESRPRSVALDGTCKAWSIRAPRTVVLVAIDASLMSRPLRAVGMCGNVCTVCTPYSVEYCVLRHASYRRQNEWQPDERPGYLEKALGVILGH